MVDQVATSPVIYYVHTDHLQRPVAMTDGGQNIAWSATYTPFGAVQTISTPSTTMDLRFPGQWFQLETGLHYNWHRHYDPATGRYLQPDPLIVDDDGAYIGGLSTVLSGTTSSVSNAALIAGTIGIPRAAARAVLPDGPNVHGYARQNTIASVKNCARMSRLPAPMAIRRPISWVRSVTTDRGTAKIDPKMKADRV